MEARNAIPRKRARFSASCSTEMPMAPERMKPSTTRFLIHVTQVHIGACLMEISPSFHNEDPRAPKDYVRLIVREDPHPFKVTIDEINGQLYMSNGLRAFFNKFHIVAGTYLTFKFRGGNDLKVTIYEPNGFNKTPSNTDVGPANPPPILVNPHQPMFFDANYMSEILPYEAPHTSHYHTAPPLTATGPVPTAPRHFGWDLSSPGPSQTQNAAAMTLPVQPTSLPQAALDILADFEEYEISELTGKGNNAIDIPTEIVGAAGVAFPVEVPESYGPGVPHPVLDFDAAPIFYFYNSKVWTIRCGSAQTPVRIRISHATRSATLARGWGRFVNTHTFKAGDIITMKAVLAPGGDYLVVSNIVRKNGMGFGSIPGNVM